MTRKISRSFIALYFALYLCFLIPGHLAAYAGEFNSGRAMQAASSPDVHHHDPERCTICLTAGHVAAVTVDCPLCVCATVERFNPREAVSTTAGAAERSTDPRAPPAAV